MHLELSQQDLLQFKASHRVLCAQDVVQQLERALETLLLLVYRRTDCLKISDFHRLLSIAVDGQFGIPKRVSSIY